MQISNVAPTCSFQNEKCQKSFCSNANGRRDSRSKLVYIWWKPADSRCKVSPSFHKSCAFQIGIVHREKAKTNSRRKQGEFSFKFKYFARHVNSQNPTKKSLPRWSFDAMLFLTPTHHNSLVIFDFNSTSFANVESSVTWVLKVHSISQKKNQRFHFSHIFLCCGLDYSTYF